MKITLAVAVFIALAVAALFFARNAKAMRHDS